MTFHVLTVGSLAITAFLDTAPCTLIEADRRFRGVFFRHHQADDPDDGGITHLQGKYG